MHCANLLDDSAGSCGKCGAPRNKGTNFCSFCAASIPKGAANCVNCGTQIAPAAPQVQPAPVQRPVAPAAPVSVVPGSQPQPPANKKSTAKDGLSIASLITGVLSIVCCCSILLPVPLGIAAMILSKKSTQKSGTTDNLSKAGKICGLVGIIIGGLALVAALVILVIGLISGDLEYWINNIIWEIETMF